MNEFLNLQIKNFREKTDLLKMDWKWEGCCDLAVSAQLINCGKLERACAQNIMLSMSWSFYF